MSDETPQIHGELIRVTELNLDGSLGTNYIVTDALTVLSFTPVYADGDEIDETNASGGQCVYYRADDRFQRADVDLTICSWAPKLANMLTGGAILTDGDAEGFAYPPLGTVAANRVSIEVWAKRIVAGDLDPDFPYAWWVLPNVRNLRIGQKTFENGPSFPNFTGQGYENANWYDGPANDWPVDSDRVAQWIPCTEAELPDVTDGYGTVMAS